MIVAAVVKHSRVNFEGRCNSNWYCVVISSDCCTISCDALKESESEEGCKHVCPCLTLYIETCIFVMFYQ